MPAEADSNPEAAPAAPAEADSSEHRAELQARGVTVVPGLLDEQWCRRLHDAIDCCRASPSQFYGVLSKPGELRVDSDLFRWFDDPDIAEVTRSSELPGLAAELVGADSAILIEDQWFASEPGAVSASPWHQDHPYYNLDRPFVTIWVTLDDVAADAALRVVAGSHAAGVTYAPIEFSTDRATIGGQSDLAPVPDVDADPERFPVTTWDLRAGDAVAIDSRTLHATGVRESADRDFRRISTRWAHPDTRYLDLGEQAAVFWKLLPHGLTTGDPVAGEVFPLITPARG